jgi:hypothetical protein
MTSRCVAALAGLILLGFAAPTAAQAPMGGNLATFDNAPPAPPPGVAPMGPPPMAAPPGMAPPPGARGGMMPGAPPGQDACERDFLPLKAAAEKHGSTLKAMMEKAQQTKTPPNRQEACRIFRNMAAAITKMVAFMNENKETCRIPDQAIQGIKAGQDNINKGRDNACASGPIGAAPGAPPPGPRLSDELGVGRIGGSGAPGRGTFDTLTGNVLAR